MRDLKFGLCRKYKQDWGNNLFLRTRTQAPKGSFPFQSPQNSGLAFVGEQNARASMKGEEREQTTLRQYIDLQRVSKIARRIIVRPGNLERATCRGLSVSFEWKRSRRRTPAIASEVRSSLYGVAKPRTQLLTMSVRGQNEGRDPEISSDLNGDLPLMG